MGGYLNIPQRKHYTLPLNFSSLFEKGRTFGAFKSLYSNRNMKADAKYWHIIIVVNMQCEYSMIIKKR